MVDQFVREQAIFNEKNRLLNVPGAVSTVTSSTQFVFEPVERRFDKILPLLFSSRRDAAVELCYNCFRRVDSFITWFLMLRLSVISSHIIVGHIFSMVNVTSC